jgi:hypothetical protein
MSGPVVLIFRILLALALYGFLGWALWTIWIDLKLTGFQSARNRVRTIHLEIRLKKQKPFIRSYSQSEVTLGRDLTSDILLEDESVSAHHAKLSFHNGQWWLEDLESKNGTKLNLDNLTTPTVVTSGDDIKCGSAHLIVSLNGKFKIPE